MTFIAARSCQQAQIRVTQDQAIATAKEQVDFTPRRTVVRLLRQGVGRKPYWIVSLSIPSRRDPDVFKRLAIVRIDAMTGEVASVEQQGVPEKASAAARAGG